MARQNRMGKGRERDKYLGKGNGLALNQEVVYRNPTQVFMRDRIGKRRIEESREVVGGQERLLTESSPIGHCRRVHSPKPTVQNRPRVRPSPPVGVTAGRSRLAMSTSRGANRPGTTRPPGENEGARLTGDEGGGGEEQGEGHGRAKSTSSSA